MKCANNIYSYYYMEHVSHWSPGTYVWFISWIRRTINGVCIYIRRVYMQRGNKTRFRDLKRDLPFGSVTWKDDWCHSGCWLIRSPRHVSTPFTLRPKVDLFSRHCLGFSSTRIIPSLHSSLIQILWGKGKTVRSFNPVFFSTVRVWWLFF